LASVKRYSLLHTKTVKEQKVQLRKKDRHADKQTNRRTIRQIDEQQTDEWVVGTRD
jgi:hypothetical protein